MTISTSTTSHPGFGDAPRQLSNICSSSQFAYLSDFALKNGVEINGASILLNGTTVSPGVGEIRGAHAAMTLTQLPRTVDRLGTERLLRTAETMENFKGQAFLIVEPGFYKGSISDFMLAPHEFVRSAVFRLIDGDKEVFRADLRPSGRQHRALLRTFAFREDYTDLARALIEQNLGRRLELRDFDPDFLAASALGAAQKNTPRHCGGPRLEFDPIGFGEAPRSYSVPRRDPDLGRALAAEAAELVERVHARSAIADRYEMLGAASDRVVVLMYPWLRSPLTDLHNFIDSFGGIYSGKIERRTPHNLWVGLKSPEITARSFLKSARALESKSPGIRFEINELRPRLSHEEFASLRQFPEIAFHSPESGVRSGRSIVAAQDPRGFFIQFNPNASGPIKSPAEDPVFFNDRHSGESALSRCELIIGGDDHPNLANRRPIFSLPPFSKMERVRELIAAALDR